MILRKVTSTVTAIVFIISTTGCSTYQVNSTDEGLGYREPSKSSNKGAVAVALGALAVVIGSTVSQRKNTE